jgi:hypothetical protein
LAYISGKKQPDRFLQALQQCDRQLEVWLNRSPANARLLVQDPAAALQAARLDLSRDAMLELIDVLKTLAQKLDLGLPESAGTA